MDSGRKRRCAGGLNGPISSANPAEIRCEPAVRAKGCTMHPLDGLACATIFVPLYSGGYPAHWRGRRGASPISAKIGSSYQNRFHHGASRENSSHAHACIRRLADCDHLVHQLSLHARAYIRRQRYHCYRLPRASSLHARACIRQLADRGHVVHQLSLHARAYIRRRQSAHFPAIATRHAESV